MWIRRCAVSRACDNVSMLKKAISVLTALTFAFPLLAGAATTAELQQQAQDLQKRAEQLQQKVGASTAGTASNVKGCPLFGKDMKRGSSGDDVRRLQQFLAKDPGVYPEGTVSGTYGPLTEVAVKRWQVKFNIVISGTPASTGFGVVGPRTTVAMISQCQGSNQIAALAAPSVGGFMTVSPIAGNAPLSVTAQVTVNTANVCGGGIYTVDYGDGTLPAQISVPANQCQQVTQTIGHTYQSIGNFQLSLAIGLHRTFATVSVFARGSVPQAQASGGQTPPPSQTPVSDSLTSNADSGQSPLMITFNGVINGQKLCTGDKYTLVFGDGEAADIPFDGSKCLAYTFQVQHRYDDPRIYTAELRKGDASGPVVGTRTITAY